MKEFTHPRIETLLVVGLNRMFGGSTIWVLTHGHTGPLQASPRIELRSTSTQKVALQSPKSGTYGCPFLRIHLLLLFFGGKGQGKAKPTFRRGSRLFDTAHTPCQLVRAVLGFARAVRSASGGRRGVAPDIRASLLLHWAARFGILGRSRRKPFKTPNEANQRKVPQ